MRSTVDESIFSSLLISALWMKSSVFRSSTRFRSPFASWMMEPLMKYGGSAGGGVVGTGAPLHANDGGGGGLRRGGAEGASSPGVGGVVAGGAGTTGRWSCA